MASALAAANPMFAGKDSDPESQSLPSRDASGMAKIADASKPVPSKVSRRVYYCLYVLLFFCIAFSALMIAAIVQLLYVTPYEPVFWLFIFSMILYWIFSFALTFTWIHVNNLKNEEERVRTCSKPACLRSARRVEFWIFIASLICSFACMMVCLRFVLPEAFFPSTDLRLRRLAGVTADTASFFIRDQTFGENIELSVLYRINGTNDAFVASSAKTLLRRENDYSSFVRVSGLSPATAYEWRFESFPDESFVFKTNPAPGQASKFSFYFGSCFLHNFPVNQEAPGFGYVMDLKPDLFTFLGDFIYSDIPFFRNDDKSTYESLYRHSLKNSHVQRVLQNIPSYNMWDDHEIRNNYPDVVGSNLYISGGSFPNAVDYAWQNYLGKGNPVTAPGKTWFDFDYGDSSFVFLDTRVDRSSNRLPDGVNKTMLGAEQKQYFKNWLLAKNSTSKFKFIMSPLGWTYDFPSSEDSWGGYKTERDELLEFIRENHIEGVVLFSGDSHFAYALEIGGAPGGMEGGFYEFSASPISAFDFTLGGFISDTPPFKSMEEREDRILWETIGRKGPMSLLGLVRVDTTLAVPEIVVEFYDSRDKIYEIKLDLTQLRPWQ